MSSAFIFLVVALAVATTASIVLWWLTIRHRDDEPDYHEQLRAIAPSARRGPVEQPPGIVPLETLSDEDL